MSVWHGDLHKKKMSGGTKRSYRMKRRFEKGSFPTETTHAEDRKKISRRHGGNIKIRLISATHVNLSNPTTGKTERVEILRVVKNPANVDYDRRGVITKGTIVETPSGTARLTSRPGQDGVANAVIIPKKAT